MNDQRFSGTHVLVTGGSRGIGRSIAGAFAAAGARVTIIGRNAAAIAEAVAAGAADAGAVADVCDRQAIAEACGEAAAARGPIGVLVANAGSALTAPFMKTDLAAFRTMLDVNLFGIVNAVQAVAPAMIERGQGRVIAIASTAGLKGYPYVSAYCAAKHAVVGYIRALALETARTGLTANAVCPGFTDTDLVETSLATIMQKTGRNRDEALASLTRHNPQGRLVEPGEVADAVLWLAGAGAASITGQTIAVAGGEI